MRRLFEAKRMLIFLTDNVDYKMKQISICSGISYATLQSWSTKNYQPSKRLFNKLKKFVETNFKEYKRMYYKVETTQADFYLSPQKNKKSITKYSTDELTDELAYRGYIVKISKG
jgi:hypothetical protein